MRKITLAALTTAMMTLHSPVMATADIDPQIVGGVESVPYSRPYQVALLMNGRQGCGGTLVASRWVLTAAHCLDNASTSGLTVRVGAHSMRANDGQSIRVKNIIKHPNWQGSRGIQSGYDIGLLELSSPASSEYKPAKLPTAQIEQQYAGVGSQNVVVSGWGLTSNRGSQSDVLREVVLPVISNSSCSSELRSNLPSSVICGGGTLNGRQVSACNGDSGGPYAVTVGSDVYSIGTVSWGKQCRGATVFTRTSSYLNWIQGYIGRITETPPVADFSHSVNGLTVNFTDTSRDEDGVVVSQEWNFGDGNTAIGANVSHTYATEGTYTVTIKATDDDNLSDTHADSVTVGKPSKGCNGLPAWSASQNYALRDTVSYKGRKYEATWWSTGAAPDVYTNVWKDLGVCDGDVGGGEPNAAFDYTKSGLTVSFTNTSIDDKGIASVNWNFGDGKTSQSMNPRHTYASGGSYRVVLTVVDTDGQTDEEIKEINLDSGSCSAPAWNAETVYLTGDRASAGGKVYEARWWVQGENPAASGPWGPWKSVGNC
ncbi:trypsin-like serine protease [Veronia pacifica]|uniref:Serine protease n=1 Tax=Veronia pacifica TaxID=1080227 RepID=A0A1C3ERJ3_9GAMM|nr:trypsin-like serine protease [Veronia pacifica]ODA35867.1 serine protease [Veronia pacifica]